VGPKTSVVISFFHSPHFTQPIVLINILSVMIVITVVEGYNFG